MLRIAGGWIIIITDRTAAWIIQPPQNNLNDINSKIQLLKQTAKELSRDADEIPALSRNTARILTSVKMLELNITDIINFKES